MEENNRTKKDKSSMKIHLFQWIVLACISVLLNFRTGNAYDDSDLLRGWTNSKANHKNKLERSLEDGIFQGPTAQESAGIKESVISVEESDVVTPAVVGGTEVNPCRKYKVSYHFLLKIVQILSSCDLIFVVSLPIPSH